MKIEVKDYSKVLRNVSILDSVNITLTSGSIYGLVGKNGCGKTMFLRAIAGLIVPTSGEVLVDGKRLHKDISFPPEMGILIENPVFLEYLTGLDNLKMLAEIQGIATEESIKAHMQQLGLDPSLRLPVRKYSLGMKQKLGIIQAIMENPKLLILDEPFNALDVESVSKLQEILLEYKNEGKMIVMTSHHMEEIEKLCDVIVFMEDGKLKVN